MQPVSAPEAARVKPGHLRWTALLAVLPLAAAAQSSPPAVRPLIEAPLPLVLKDGRIARIGIYGIPFATGSAEPLPGALEELDRLAAGWATDCFLSAQVIGHVAPGSGRDGDTLAAHRLARARADRLQAALIRRGLPQDAIASVWDWQFFVPESRATLWVFELVPGEDCDGRALAARDGETPAARPQEAAGRGTLAQTTPPADAGDASTARDPEPTPLTGDAAGTTWTAEDAGWAVPERAGASAGEREPRDEVAEAGVPSEEPATAARTGAREVGGSTGSGSAGGETDGAASPPVAEGAPAVVAAADPAADTLGAEEPAGDEAVLEVQFDVNSSFLPNGASRALREFLDRLGEGRLAIRLEGAVAEGGVANARTPEEARRYNEWITTRRVNRVREWLERHASGRIVEVEQELVGNDPSRRVVIRVRRLP